MSRSALNSYTSGLPLRFDELVLGMLKAGRGVNQFDFGGSWFGIGRPDDYNRANAEFGVLGPLLLPQLRVEAA